MCSADTSEEPGLGCVCHAKCLKHNRCENGVRVTIYVSLLRPAGQLFLSRPMGTVELLPTPGQGVGIETRQPDLNCIYCDGGPEVSDTGLPHCASASPVWATTEATWRNIFWKGVKSQLEWSNLGSGSLVPNHSLQLRRKSCMWPSLLLTRL